MSSGVNTGQARQEGQHRWALSPRPFPSLSRPEPPIPALTVMGWQGLGPGGLSGRPGIEEGTGLLVLGS